MAYFNQNIYIAYLPKRKSIQVLPFEGRIPATMFLQMEILWLQVIQLEFCSRRSQVLIMEPVQGTTIRTPHFRGNSWGKFPRRFVIMGFYSASSNLIYILVHGKSAVDFGISICCWQIDRAEDFIALFRISDYSLEKEFFSIVCWFYGDNIVEFNMQSASVFKFGIKSCR